MDTPEFGGSRTVHNEIKYKQNNTESATSLSEPAIETQLNWVHDGDAVSNMPNGEGFPKMTDTEGSQTYTERLLTEQKGITFMGEKLTGAPKIKTSDDVAFLFRNLERAASENAFVVLHKPKGDYSVLYLSTGTSTATGVDVKTIAAAVKETGAVAITLVHNHPSGSLVPSAYDKKMHANIRMSVGVPVKSSVIIDLDSGKYGVFDESFDASLNKPEYKGKVKTAKVYQFDRQHLYTPVDKRSKLLSSEDVAKYLSSHKRGTKDKYQLMVTDNRGGITRYALLDFGLTEKELKTSILAEVGKHGENAYHNELIDAYQDRRKMKPAGTNIPKSVLFVEKTSYVCIGLAFLLLAVYSLAIII